MADEVSVGVRTAPSTPAVLRFAVDGYDSVMRVIHAIGWWRIRFAAAIVYFAVIGNGLVDSGVPTGRKTLTYIIVTGLAITCLGRGWRRMLLIVVDWLPFTLVLMTYDQSRAIADTLGMPVHELDVARAERWLFGAHIPTVWLQQHFYDPATVHWYDAVATVIYSSHFMLTPVLAGIFWIRDRKLWLRYISRVIVLSFAGLATYVVFPEAPPWLASKDGYIGPVTRLSARGWEYLHAGFANRLIEAGQSGGSNAVAAMPSLHFAFAVLAAMFVADRFTSRRRYLFALYPIVMALTLVYTGEHYVIDLVFGLLYAAAVHLGLNRWDRWWAGRTEHRSAVRSDTADVPDEQLEPVSVE
ncbi:MAG: phosphatase PAP2 family protein [Jatrophihabitantaceae bacterium]